MRHKYYIQALITVCMPFGIEFYETYKKKFPKKKNVEKAILIPNIRFLIELP